MLKMKNFFTNVVTTIWWFAHQTKRLFVDYKKALTAFLKWPAKKKCKLFEGLIFCVIYYITHLLLAVAELSGTIYCLIIGDILVHERPLVSMGHELYIAFCGMLFVVGFGITVYSMAFEFYKAWEDYKLTKKFIKAKIKNYKKYSLFGTAKT